MNTFLCVVFLADSFTREHFLSLIGKLPISVESVAIVPRSCRKRQEIVTMVWRTENMEWAIEMYRLLIRLSDNQYAVNLSNTND